MANAEAHLKAYAAADALYKRRQYQKAIALFRRALALAPGNADTLWAMADCYSELKRPRIAERFYRAALLTSKKKQRSALLYNIGNALFDQKLFREAIRYYGRVRTKAARKNIAASKNRLLTSGSRRRSALRAARA